MAADEDSDSIQRGILGYNSNTPNAEEKYRAEQAKAQRKEDTQKAKILTKKEKATYGGRINDKGAEMVTNVATSDGPVENKMKNDEQNNANKPDAAATNDSAPTNDAATNGANGPAMIDPESVIQEQNRTEPMYGVSDKVKGAIDKADKGIRGALPTLNKAGIISNAVGNSILGGVKTVNGLMDSYRHAMKAVMNPTASGLGTIQGLTSAAQQGAHAPEAAVKGMNNIASADDQLYNEDISQKTKQMGNIINQTISQTLQDEYGKSSFYDLDAKELSVAVPTINDKVAEALGNAGIDYQNDAQLNKSFRSMMTGYVTKPTKAASKGIRTLNQYDVNTTRMDYRNERLAKKIADDEYKARTTQGIAKINKDMMSDPEYALDDPVDQQILEQIYNSSANKSDYDSGKRSLVDDYLQPTTDESGKVTGYQMTAKAYNKYMSITGVNANDPNFEAARNKIMKVKGTDLYNKARHTVQNRQPDLTGRTYFDKVEAVATENMQNSSKEPIAVIESARKDGNIIGDGLIYMGVEKGALPYNKYSYRVIDQDLKNSAFNDLYYNKGKITEETKELARRKTAVNLFRLSDKWLNSNASMVNGANKDFEVVVNPKTGELAIESATEGIKPVWGEDSKWRVGSAPIKVDHSTSAIDYETDVQRVRSDMSLAYIKMDELGIFDNTKDPEMAEYLKDFFSEREGENTFFALAKQILHDDYNNNEESWVLRPNPKDYTDGEDDEDYKKDEARWNKLRELVLSGSGDGRMMDGPLGRMLVSAMELQNNFGLDKEFWTSSEYTKQPTASEMLVAATMKDLASDGSILAENMSSGYLISVFNSMKKAVASSTATGTIDMWDFMGATKTIIEAIGENTKEAKEIRKSLKDIMPKLIEETCADKPSEIVVKGIFKDISYKTLSEMKDLVDEEGHITVDPNKWALKGDTPMEREDDLYNKIAHLSKLYNTNYDGRNKDSWEKMDDDQKSNYINMGLSLAVALTAPLISGSKGIEKYNGMPWIEKKMGKGGEKIIGHVKTIETYIHNLNILKDIVKNKELTIEEKKKLIDRYDLRFLNTNDFVSAVRGLQASWGWLPGKETKIGIFDPLHAWTDKEVVYAIIPNKTKKRTKKK